MVENRKSNDNRLRVRRGVDVPLHEVSGICLRRGENGRMSLIAVGDRMSKIAWFSLPRSDDGRIDWHTSDIAKLSGSMLPQDTPRSRLSALTASGAFCCSRKHLACRTDRPQGAECGSSIDLAMDGGRRNRASASRKTRFWLRRKMACQHSKTDGRTNRSGRRLAIAADAQQDLEAANLGGSLCRLSRSLWPFPRSASSWPRHWASAPTPLTPTTRPKWSKIHILLVPWSQSSNAFFEAVVNGAKDAAAQQGVNVDIQFGEEDQS